MTTDQKQALKETLLTQPDIALVCFNELGEWSFNPREGFTNELTRSEVLADLEDIETANFNAAISDAELVAALEARGLTVPAELMQTAADKTDAGDELLNAPEDYSKWTVPELREKLEELEIAIPDGSLKIDLINLINNKNK